MFATMETIEAPLQRHPMRYGFVLTGINQLYYSGFSRGTQTTLHDTVWVVQKCLSDTRETENLEVLSLQGWMSQCSLPGTEGSLDSWRAASIHSIRKMLILISVNEDRDGSLWTYKLSRKSKGKETKGKVSVFHLPMSQ